jgi:hypothetical protein
LHGKERLFPVNYVEKVSSTPSSANQNGTSKPIANTQGDKFLFYGCAMYSYTGQYDDELSFQRGDVLKIIAEQMNGWYRGNIVNLSRSSTSVSEEEPQQQEDETIGEDGIVGLIPGNYVQRLTLAEVKDMQAKASLRTMNKEQRRRALPTPPTKKTQALTSSTSSQGAPPLPKTPPPNSPSTVALHSTAAPVTKQQYSASSSSYKTQDDSNYNTNRETEPLLSGGKTEGNNSCCCIIV